MHSAAHSPLSHAWLGWSAVLLLAFATGCTTLRGRADDALERGDFRRAVELYGQVLARDPKDARSRELLVRAERGLFDQMLDRMDGARRAGRTDDGLAAGLATLQAKDRFQPSSVDDARRARLVAAVEWSATTLRADVEAETKRGRALAARARRAARSSWLARPEIGSLASELDAEIARAGVATCASATTTAAREPFALELVAAYCKAVGGAMPDWMARPYLVGGASVLGTILGTPPNEQVEIERAVASALERSVWFTATTEARARVQVQGAVNATFSEEPIELTRSWLESVPYQATESYQVPIEVPYVETETYTERVPYTAYEDRLESCAPPKKGLCREAHPVTRYRDESRTREVRKVRTEYRTRTREVTRYRDEPRVFRFPATKHSGRYEASFFVTVDVGSGVRPIEARASVEDARVANEHDAEFAPAGVHPERAELPSAMWWRDRQRERLRSELLSALDRSWLETFCNEGVSSIEEAARCARVRPSPIPSAVRRHLLELIGDDPDQVIALPRPGESVR